MNKEKQRIAIAEACGWSNLQDSDYKPFGKAQLVGRHPGGSEQNLLRVPDYLNDLNAMHESEKVLSRGKNYYQLGGFGFYLKTLGQIIYQSSCVDSTAAQRAEAFLRTIGKWEDK
jgi:hypothetical protein